MKRRAVAGKTNNHDNRKWLVLTNTTQIYIFFCVTNRNRIQHCRREDCQRGRSGLTNASISVHATKVHFPRSEHIYFFTDFSRGFYSLNASHRPLPNSLCSNTTCRQTKNKAPNVLKSTHAVSILYLGTFNTLRWLAELSSFGQKRGSEVRFLQYNW